MGEEISKKGLTLKTEIIESPCKLKEIRLDLSGGHPNYKDKFTDSYIREAIKELGFDIKPKFFFFQTTANLQADKIIRENYLNFEIQTCTSWHFNTDIMNFLLRLIHENNEHHIYFPIVENIGVHSLNTYSEQIYWPSIHILKDASVVQRQEFTKSVEYVLEDNFEKIEKYESPYNYNLEIYQLLKKGEIPPLLLQEGPVFTGSDLKKAIDWLLPYQYTRKYQEFIDD